MLPRVEGVGCGGDAQLSAQKTPLLYPGQNAALYHICHAPLAFSAWAQVLVALPDPTGKEIMREATLKGAAFVSGCRALPRFSMILACLRELLKKQDVWLGGCSIFITVLGVAYSVEKT